VTELKIHRIYFKDFGIFRDQGLEEISDLAVIAGPNRAGKTTFMTALRYLGYGLPKKSFIPPPQREQLEYNADVVNDDGSLYNIQIQGYSRPKVYPLNGSPPIDLEDLYGLDGFTYRQIFTISLDELKKIPEGLDSSEQKSLNMVLLESGLYNALRLTKIREEMNKKAYAIGRKKGSKNSGQFKDKWLVIKKGIEELNEANKQRDLYRQKKEELAQIAQKEIPEITEKLENSRKRLELLYLLLELYDKYSSWLTLNEKLNSPQNRDLINTYPKGGLERAEELSSKYHACLEEYEQCLKEFNYSQNKDKFWSLIKNASVLETYKRELSGWKEKLNNYLNRQSLHQKTEQELIKKLKRINPQWGENLEVLSKLNFDINTEEVLRRAFDEYSNIEKKLEDTKERKKQLEMKIAYNEESKRDIKGIHTLPKAFPFFILGGILLCILAAFLFGPLTAAASALVLSSGILSYYFYFQSQSAQIKSRLDNLENEISRLKDEFSMLCSEENRLENIFENLMVQITEIKNKFGLDAGTPINRLWDISLELKNLKEKYESWFQEKKELQEIKNQLLSMLQKAGETLTDLKYNLSKEDENENIEDHLMEIFSLIERAVDDMEKAQKLHEVMKEKEHLEEEIAFLLRKENPQYSLPAEPQNIKEDLSSFIKRGRVFEKLKEEEGLLRETEQILITALGMEKRKILLKEIISKGRSDEALSLLELFGFLYQQYAAKESVEREITQLEQQIKNLEEELESKRERKTTLEIEMRELSSDQKILKAYNKIYTAKISLERLAEQYAVYRLAEMMIQGVQKALIEKTKSQFLGTAGLIFKQLTAGDYEKIIISESNGSFDFKVVPKGSSSEAAVDILSRATKEQLFLTLRISRIKDIRPSLPVIFDDSLVNFDPCHRRQAVNIISELIKTNQVFVLTCHPELLEDLKEICEQVQYWRLENGKFYGPFTDCSEIIHWLDQYSISPQ